MNALSEQLDEAVLDLAWLSRTTQAAGHRFDQSIAPVGGL
jgi:hypothetical protein